MASTYLSRTPASSGSSSVLTYSFWTKRSGLGVLSPFLSGGNSGTVGQIVFSASDQLNIYNGASVIATTNAKFRDTSAWYHIVISLNSSETGTDKCKIWINGVQETSFATDNRSTFTTISQVNQSGIVQYVGSDTTGYVNGLMSHIHMVDGTAYDASAFGETDATTGIWKPKLSPSVTYGTNGFFLKFNEGALGTDSSPNGNNFTVNGSLTPAKDTPDNVYATLNPLDGNYNNNGVPSLSNGNLVNTDSAGYKPAFGTLAVSKGKWYYEYRFAGTPDSWVFGGWGNSLLGGSSLSVYRNSDGQLFDGSTYNAYGASYSAGDIIGVAFDYDNDQITFYKNGVSQGTATSLGINTDLSFPMVGVVSTGASIDVNFGNGYFGTTPVASAGSNGNGAIFEFDCPTGYYALNTKNINTYG